MSKHIAIIHFPFSIPPHANVTPEEEADNFVRDIQAHGFGLAHLEDIIDVEEPNERNRAMNTEVKNSLMTMRTERLVEIIGSLASECGVELHRGFDPADGTAVIFGSNANMGTFSLADIDSVDDAWRIDMDPKHEHLVRIEGCTDQVCDLLNEAVANEINAFEIISKPTGSGCGCNQSPPCIGCAPQCPPCQPQDLINGLHLFKVYTIDEDLTESDPVFVMALCKDGAACLFHKARSRDHCNILCEVVVSKVQSAEDADE
jgi:hypothetical protein